MSGKAPPRGPRALLSSLPTGQTSPASTSSQPSPSAPASPTKKIPTGPRSLTNGIYNVSPPMGLSRSIKSNPSMNGHVNAHNAHVGPSSVTAKSPPTGPSALLGRLSDKGKQVDRTPAAPTNGVKDPRLTASATDKLPTATIKFSFPAKRTPGVTPPQPPSEPPPPPPPSQPPPPPPPPSSEPPPPPPAPPLIPPPPNEPAPPPPPSILPITIPLPPPSASSSLPASVVAAFNTPNQLVSAPPPPPTTAPVPTSPPPPPPPKSPTPEPVLYSLPPLPAWPPDRSEYNPGKNYKCIYDPLIDKDRDGRLRSLLEKVRVHLPSSTAEDSRIKGRVKGKETLWRYDGEVVPDEPEIVIQDPRQAPGVKLQKSHRPLRSEFHEIHWEYDSNSTGPPPPTAVLVTNVSPLAQNTVVRRHFGAHGMIMAFEPQMDMEKGGSLGIYFIRYNTHEEAKRCVEKEDGKRLGVGGGMGMSVGPQGKGEEVRVILDGEGSKLKAILKELDEGRRRAVEEKRRKEREAKVKEANAAVGIPPTTTCSQTPQQSGWWPPGQQTHSTQPIPGLPNRPSHLPLHPNPTFNTQQPQLPIAPTTTMLNGTPAGPSTVIPGRIRKPPAALVRARMAVPTRHPLPLNPTLHFNSLSSTPTRPHGLPSHLSRLDTHMQASPMSMRSRSPSPISRRPGQAHQSVRQREHEAINQLLSKNGFDHARIDGTDVNRSITEDDVKKFFEGFKIDTILQDHLGWYITFQASDTARRAAMFLNSGARTLAHRTVNISVHPSPSKASLSATHSGKTKWNEDEIVEHAEQMIVKELKGMLEKDVTERIVGAHLRKMVSQDKARKAEEKAKAGSREGRTEEIGEPKLEKRGLKGLSFKKPRKREMEESRARDAELKVETEAFRVLEGGYAIKDHETTERPRKRRKVESTKKAPRVVEEIESEDDDGDTLTTEALDVALKRTISEDREEGDEPPKKRTKAAHLQNETKIPPKKVSKKPKKPVRPTKDGAVIDVVLPSDLEFDIPEVAQVHVKPGFDSSLSPSPSPLPRELSPSVDPIEQRLCQDDEDLYFTRLALSGISGEELDTPAQPTFEADHLPPFRTHITGSARTEGYYKISHAEKSAYVAQYALRTTAATEATPVEAPPAQHITSSRSNRANARRRALGLEEINQVQRAVALSKGETAAEMTVKFNQLQTRKKHLRFARSPIHDWGLYAMERITRGEMVIEYVGEVIRAQVADKREKAYERQGIGSSYLFRIDEDLVVDATKKGNLGRLINHACDPNCTAKIITINSEKKIVIYAKRDIELGDEITYDYHFPIEQDKIPCLCGSSKCRGYLN